MNPVDRVIFLTTKISSFQSHLNRAKEIIEKSDYDIMSLIARLDNLKGLFVDYQNFIDELSAIEPAHVCIQDSLETFDLYYNVIGQFEIVARSHDETRSLTSSNRYGSVETNNDTRATQSLKLERIKIPTFNGEYEDWLPFKDAFEALVDKQSIPDVEKFQHLQTALKDGKAKNKISGYATTGDNYRKVWELLIKSYEVKRLLLKRHLQLLDNMPTQKEENSAGLDQLADQIQQHSVALSKMGHPIDSAMLVHMVENKLARKTVEKWEDTLSREQVPNIDDMCEFLYKTAAILAGRNKSKREVGQDQPPSFKKRRVENAHTFFTQNTNNKSNHTGTRNCVLCRDSQHPLYHCPKFINMSISQRVELIKKERLCYNCMQDHRGRDCTHGECKKCSKKHNTMLHYDKAYQEKKNTTTNLPPTIQGPKPPTA